MVIIKENQLAWKFEIFCETLLVREKTFRLIEAVRTIAGSNFAPTFLVYQIVFYLWAIVRLQKQMISSWLWHNGTCRHFRKYPGQLIDERNKKQQQQQIRQSDWPADSKRMVILNSENYCHHLKKGILLIKVRTVGTLQVSRFRNGWRV